MEKKYQVFISSTFADFVEERKALFDVVLTTDCIPAGMESFVATDDEQFEVIKRVIDLCDYYILLIGARYGTINDKTGKSYTEMEYGYAISKKIPVLVFARNNADELPENMKDTDEQKKKKLIFFKEKAMKNRLATVWNTIDELKYRAAISIMNAKTQFDRPGWIRGDSVISQETYLGIIEENTRLKKEIENNLNPISSISEYDYLQKKITINFIETVYVWVSGMRAGQKQLTFTFEEIFKQISGGLTAMVDILKFNELVDNLCHGYHTNDITHNKIKAFFIGKGLIKSDNLKNKNTLTEVVGLTEKGLSLMSKLSE